MNAFVIDSSVVVKWFSRESDTPAALTLRDALYRGECRILAPDLLLYELANALRFHPRFSQDDASAAVASVQDLGIEFAAPDPDLLRRAVDLAFRLKTTVYDACFLAMADLRGVPLVSADEKLIVQAKGFKGVIRLSDLSSK
jgi:predicted nucleic acid-binding protein